MSTWLVTGASRGIGLELVRTLLERGENVAATTRSAERLDQALGGSADWPRLLPLEIDLADEKQVGEAVAAVTERFGGLDVVVNNAGYGHLGAVEEISDAEVRKMFDVQVFGVWNVLRAVLPQMRTARAGHIVNVSSIVGLVPFPGWGLYTAGKFALEGLTDSLAAEVAHLGIRVNLVEPGYVRTDFLRAGSLALPQAPVEGYEAVREMIAQHQAMPGTQLGDPVKVAAAIVEVVERGDAPLHQLLGSDSYALAGGRLDTLRAEVEAGKALAFTTDV
ncbi:SDR family NAD(P)-dependent oxidoreductase [Kineosporia rhizophila]|uniref:SDR family NAD(P)-dependent oxidoreductase n=1 Tax=Kineosporia rhizophila TaxID=84633 RepID=UPI001E353319|nr:SDR family NAD(P)-dependent oxidoreductase [Kineosporia rhizophila]MCE0537192.1 SDR family NAD(P)-dependent oxidoreductase [Kineosporia rhizophila]